MNPVATEIIEDRDRLESLAPDWAELWRRCPRALPFQSPAWLIPWWRHFSPGKLFTAAVRTEDRLVGLAPGYIEDGPLGRRILPLGISLSDHLDILADPDCPEEAMAGLSAVVAARGHAWDIWELEDLPPDALALRLPLPPGCTETVQPHNACPALFLPEGDSELSEILPRTKRRHLNLARNRARRRGEVRVERIEGDATHAALEHLFRLHRKRWETRGGDGVLAPDPVQAFQRQAVPLLQRAGLLRLYLLSIADQVVAAHYELAHAIKCAAAEGFREVDFLRGQEAYKYEWGAVDLSNLKRSIRHG